MSGGKKWCQHDRIDPGEVVEELDGSNGNKIEIDHSIKFISWFKKCVQTFK